MPRPYAGDLGTPEHLTHLYERVARVERRPSSAPPILFSFAGVPASGVLSPPYKLRGDASAIDLTGLLGTAGSANTTVGVYDGATLLASVTLGSGATDVSSSTAVSVAAGTVVRVKATAVGASAEDLTLEATFR